ncbi:Gfo/Idh/MocA family protein [Sediminibacillus halophilus]|uniref:Predicted dehydrogenase n=1 Tax=Sediminibacillus halophilus TaxID=482461 RepID=A0A1G9VW09_9BACI|nr:Gfo/Idh/MocA family oxidoreductase [Sediminibacillus halophilus]SDM76464.1 Predicted dehydrogenase [Sediminibacillus halophilus]
MSYSIGLIGCGHIAYKHLETISTLSNVNVAAVSDLQEERMETIVSVFQKKTNKPQAIKQYIDYSDLLSDPAVDIVVIAVVSGLHAEIAKQALQQQKHVILEKPISLSLKDADEINQLAQAYNRKVLVCHQLRYRPFMYRLKELIDKGYFGKPYMGVASLRINRSKDYFQAASWRGSWSTDGGMLVNQGIHLIDLMIWLLGEPASVYGEIANYSPEVKEIEDVAAGIISFSNKAKGIIEANTVTKPENIGYQLSIFAEKGTVSIGGPGLDKIDRCYVQDHDELTKELKELAGQKGEHCRMYENFIESVEGDAELLVTGEEGKRALEVIFGLYRSHQQGKNIPSPLPSFSTTMMLDNFKNRK